MFLLVLSTFLVQALADYDEAFVKSQMLPLSAAAYSPDVNKCLEKIHPGIEVGLWLLDRTLPIL